MEQLRLDTSTRLAVRDAEAIEWRASDDLAPRHAFETRDGVRWSLCRRLRFTAAFGAHGNSTCPGCLAALRDRVVAATAPVAGETELEARAAWGDR